MNNNDKRIFGIPIEVPFIKGIKIVFDKINTINNFSQIWLIIARKLDYSQEVKEQIKKVLNFNKKIKIISLTTIEKIFFYKNLVNFRPLSLNEQEEILIQLIMKSESLSFISSIKEVQELGKIMNEIDIDEFDLRDYKEMNIEDSTLGQIQLFNPLFNLIYRNFPKIIKESGKIPIIQMQKKSINFFLNYCSKHKQPIILIGYPGRSKIDNFMIEKTILDQNNYVVFPSYNKLDLTNKEVLINNHINLSLKEILKKNDINIKEQIEVINLFTPYKLFFQSLINFSENNSNKIKNEGSFRIPHFNFIVCSNFIEEAKIIALQAYKEFLLNKKITIFCKDFTLARSIQGELERFNKKVILNNEIQISQSLYGQWILITSFILYKNSLTSILNIIKHPFCSLNIDINTFEKESRSNNSIFWKILPKEVEILMKKIFNIEQVMPLSRYFDFHSEIINRLSSNLLKVKKIWTDISASFKNYSYSITGKEYYLFLSHKLKNYKEMYQSINSFNTIRLTSNLENSLIDLDFTVLSGFNEEIWVEPLIKNDSWLTPYQRKQIGLLTTEQKIGLLEQDIYFILTNSTKILITRSESFKGTPYRATRWWEKIQTIITDYKMDVSNDLNLKENSRIHLIENYPHLTLEVNKNNFYKKRPSPNPLKENRPNEYSLSSIYNLIKDPYVFYIKSILKITPEPKIERDFSLFDFKELIKKILISFIEQKLILKNKSSLFLFGIKTINDLPLPKSKIYFLIEKWRSVSNWVMNRWNNRFPIKITNNMRKKFLVGKFNIYYSFDLLEEYIDNNIGIINFIASKGSSEAKAYKTYLKELILLNMFSLSKDKNNVSIFEYSLFEEKELEKNSVMENIKNKDYCYDYSKINTLLSLYEKEAYSASIKPYFPEYEPFIRRKEWISEYE